MVSDTWLRAGSLAAIALLWTAGYLSPFAYLGLLAGSSVLSAWATPASTPCCPSWAGRMGGWPPTPLYSAQASLAVIAGRTLAGLLVAPLGTGSLLGLDAASFASWAYKHGGHGQAPPPLTIRSMSARPNRVSGCCASSA